MSLSYLSPNMSLVIPVPTQELGPNWAYDLNASLTIVDGHNHSPGSGVQIPTAGININADLSYNNSNNAIGLRSVRFFNQVSALVGASDLGCIYEAGGDFYYNNSSGTAVRITNGSSVSGSSGTITGLPSGTASASYQASPGTFRFQQATSTAANMDAATLIVRYPGSYPSPSGNYIALQAPSALASGYSLTLPSLPAMTNIMSLDTSGNIAATINVDGVTLQLSASVLSVIGGIGALMPAGAIIPFGGSSAPTGYLLCDGSSYVRSSFTTLFSAIGTAYGAADGTHFNVPDLRGQFLRGVDGGAGRDPNTLTRTAMNTGGNTGDNVGSVQAYTNATHTHTLTDPGHAHNRYIQGDASGPSGTFILGPSARDSTGVTGASLSATTGITMANSGGSETRPINAYVNFIIKT